MKEENQNIFTEQEIDSLYELGRALKKIHVRLIAEGYTIKDGKILKEKQ